MEQVDHGNGDGEASEIGKAGRNKLTCNVACLDDTKFNVNIEKNAPGKLLIERICEHLKLDEKEYFGLLFIDKSGGKRWVDSQKPIKKQLHGCAANFEFAVKFFEPRPEELKNQFTRYLMALQLREEIANGGLPCSFSAQALLGSYVIQSEFGDYDPFKHTDEYLDGLVFAPEQSPELIEKIKDLHKQHTGLVPSDADMQYLEYARKLTLYGVDLHEAKDMEGTDIHVGVSFMGIAMYKDHIRTNKFPWPKIDEVKYKGRNFFVKIKPGEYASFVTTVVFKTPSDRATKELYKSVVEHHTFYRLREPDSPKGGTLPRLHSRFRYSDRTLFQLHQGTYNSLPRTLTRGWSDRQRRKSERDEEGLEIEPIIQQAAAPNAFAEPAGTMDEFLPAKVAGDEQEQPMDVVFTFGACGPNADEVFDKEKDMVTGFLETISDSNTQYGVIEYGESKATIKAKLGDYRNKERLNQYISTIPRSGEGRAIDKALEKARELLLDNGRNHARKALVIFANGKSSARLAELTNEANLLHDAGVKIIAVGIGDDVDDEELNSIATNKDKVILAQPYDEAVPLGHLLAHEVSEAPPKELVDLTFIMGASGSDGDAAFEKQKEIINSLVDSLQTNDAQMAIVNYDDESSVRAKLGEFKDKEDFKKCVDKQERTGEGKALDKSLGDAANVVRQSGRPGVRKAVVVFANGKSGAEIVDLVREAQALHGNDVKVVAVGIGDDVSEEELKAVANTAVILAKNCEESDAIARSIAKELDVMADAPQDFLDIAFAFGSSGPDADAVFKKEKEMIGLFIDSLKVHNTQYGLIDYSSEARVHATLGQFPRKEALKAHVSSIQRKGEGVGLDKALASAHELLVDNGRREARKVLVVFTSGNANVGVRELRAGAKRLQDAGVKIVTVAIGDQVDESQLKEISSDEQVISSQVSDDSRSVVQLIADNVHAEVTGEVIDLMFALGAGGVEAEMVFEKEKEMVYAFVNSVDSANIRYALIEYAEKATLQANFNEYKEKHDFKQFVNLVKRIGEGVGLDDALQQAAAVFGNSGRANAKRVLVVFTNAQSKARSNDLQKHSKDLQESGVKVVVVAIGSDVSEKEINDLSSHGEPVLRVQPHDDANTVVKDIASSVLGAEPVSVIDGRPKMKIDVVFAVGAAGRDANEVFDKEKEITNSFIDNLKDNDTRFAVIEFGHKATVKSHLGEERDAGKLKASVKEMTRSGDGKCLDKVLEQAVQLFQNEARPASTRVLLVLTNAKSTARTNDLKKHAQSLHEAGVKVQVVAVGNEINEEELKQVTSDQVPLLRVQPYEEPQSVVHNAAWILGGKQGEFLDIVFAFGSFGDTAEDMFEKEKELINSFIDSIHKRDTHFGVIEIGPRAKICASIGEYRDDVRLKRHVNLIRRSGDATGLDHALELASCLFSNQARPSSRRVLIVFTNGRSGSQASELRRHSEHLHNNNVDIILVAIGDNVDDEELQYVSSGGHPIINIAPEQNSRAVVYSIVAELEEAKTTEPLDIVFAIGAAGEEAETVYNKNKEIMSKFIEANKTPNTMYSVVNYGNKAVVHSKLGDEKDCAALQENIEGLERAGEGTALDKALEQSINILEHQGRHGSRKRVIVFANGHSKANQNNLKKYVTALEDANVKVVTVAVGPEINEEELRNINPDEETIVKVDALQDAESVVFAVARQVQEPTKPKYDIIFTFGATGNAADMIHLKEKEMICSFINSFESGDYRYGVVEYGTKASVKAKFDDIHDKTKLKEFVNTIHRSGEGKGLDKALEQSHELFKKHGRQSARKVLIIFTNGKSSARASELKKHAHNLAEMNTKVIVVAIGDDVSLEELNGITTEEGIVQTQPDDDHHQMFANIVRDNIEERPVTDIDVVFAIGASGSHGNEMFEKEKEFVKGFIDASQFGNVEYGLLEYGNEVKVHMMFKDFDEKEKVKEKVSSLQRSGDATSMVEGLRKAGELFTKDGRAHAHKVLVVMLNGTVGGRAGELRTGAKSLQNKGIKVITVAIGDDVDKEELRYLSSEEENIIQAKCNEDVASVAYVMSHQAVKGTPVHEELVREEKFARTVFLQPRMKFVICQDVQLTKQRMREDDERKRKEEEEERVREELEKQQEEERQRQEEERQRQENERQRQEKERQRQEKERQRQEEEDKQREIEKKQKENERRERKRQEKEEEEKREKERKEEEQRKEELEDELVMMPFAVATPETETVKVAHRKTLDLDDTLAEKASFVRVEDGGTAKPSEEREEKHVTETVTRQQTTSATYISPSSLQDDVINRDRDTTPEIEYSLKQDLNLEHEQGERGFVRGQIKSQESEIKRRSYHEPNYSSLERAVKTTIVTNVLESSPNDDVFPAPPPSPPHSSSEIPNVETRTVIYEPASPTHVSHHEVQMKGDPVVVTRRVKIDSSPMTQTTKTTQVVRHTSTPAEVVTKTITIEGDGEPLTASELAEIMNMSGAEGSTTASFTTASFHKVEKVHKVEQVVTSKQFTHTGHSFLIETGDPDADAAIMKALEDARKEDPNVQVAEVTVTKQETENDD